MIEIHSRIRSRSATAWESARHVTIGHMAAELAPWSVTLRRDLEQLASGVGQQPVPPAVTVGELPRVFGRNRAITHELTRIALDTCQRLSVDNDTC